MTPRELADLLMRARAAGVLGTYFDHEPAPLAALLTFYGDERAAQELAELQRQLGEQTARLLKEQAAHQAIRQTAARFVQKWRDGTVWGSDELRHFYRQFDLALRALT